MNKLSPTSTRRQSLTDFTNKLSAKWLLRTRPNKSPNLGDDDSLEAIFKTLVEYKTTEQNPEITRVALDFIQQYLTRRGLVCTRYEWDGFESLIAGVRKTKKPKIILAAHLDVMAAPEEMFTLQKRDGKYFGRGVLDMKCSIAAYLKAIDELEHDLQSYDFSVMITTDEELGARDGINGVKRLIEAGYIPQMLILPDGGRDWQPEIMAKGFVHYTLEAHGKMAHGSRPWEGENAALKLIEAINEIKANFKDQGPETDTLNLGVIRSGEIVNKIPDYARAEVEMRLSQKGALEKRKKFIEDICGKHGIECTLRTGWEPLFNDINHPFVKAYADITTEVTGVAVTGFKSFGGSDARYYAEIGVPYANAYPRGNGHHSTEEWITEESLPQLKEIMRLYLERQARRTPPR